MAASDMAVCYTPAGKEALVPARLALLLLLLILGCDREPPALSAATAPANETVATTHPATLPSPGTIWIDQKPYDLPPAVLIVQRKDGDLDLELMTVDP